jgi:uncharacterized repeat protein (TIGR01451 family)
VLATARTSSSLDSLQGLPAPRPKLSLSSKQAYPTIVYPGGVVTYTITLRNTGAEAALAASLRDPFPAGTFYNGDAWASSGNLVEGSTGITWTGDVAFDDSVVITFSATVSHTYAGRITNQAFLTQAAIPSPVTLTAVCTATDRPILNITKEGVPLLAGAGKPLTYTLFVHNAGQPAANLPITVTDRLPSNTTLLALGPGAISDTMGQITWTRSVTLGPPVPFTFSVLVDEGVPSGTILLNQDYAVTSTLAGVGDVGEPYTLTVVTPIFLLTKETDPDPPGSNRALAYTLTLRNFGSLATEIVVTDTVATNVTYLSGGTYFSPSNTVSWTLPQLASGAKASFTYSVYVGNLPGGTPIVNDNYGVSCAEGIAAAGVPLTSTIQGPIFDTSYKAVDPIAKKPGGGVSTLTYTIGIRNTGAGNAHDAHLYDIFHRVSFDGSQVEIIPPIGVFTVTNPGGQRRILEWVGDIDHDSEVTIIVHEASSVFAGIPVVTNTAWITDDLTLPMTVTTQMLVTHDARLNVYKTGPEVIGPNELMTYTLRVWNSAFTTDEPVWLTDTIPAEVNYITSSHGGRYISATRTVSWTLPPFSPGDELTRTLTVLAGDLVSGTLIVNEDFLAGCPNCAMTDTVFLPLTTTVQLRGLGDSYKEVWPALAYPGPAVVLTFTVHVVNSSGFHLDSVQLYDHLPWVQSTYHRDAVASAGSVISDIVHVEWTGSVGPYSSEAITMSVTVDPWYKGPVTNTAVITHPSLSQPVTVTAVAYVTDEPVLRLQKKGQPDPVGLGQELLYTIRLRNLGQRATGIVISDTVPMHTTYVPGSATRGGGLVGDDVLWAWPELEAETSEVFQFRVLIERGPVVLNEFYSASCAEGIWAYGEPLATRVRGGMIYLPLIVVRWP